MTESIPNGRTNLEVSGYLTEMAEKRRQIFTAMQREKDVTSTNHRNLWIMMTQMVKISQDLFHRCMILMSMKGAVADS